MDGSIVTLEFHGWVNGDPSLIALLFMGAILMRISNFIGPYNPINVNDFRDANLLCFENSRSRILSLGRKR